MRMVNGCRSEPGSLLIQVSNELIIRKQTAFFQKFVPPIATVVVSITQITFLNTQLIRKRTTTFHELTGALEIS